MPVKIQISPYRPVYPSPAALIVSSDSEGRPNIMTIAEVFNVSIKEPVIVGIAIRKETYSYGLIKSRGEFTINFAPASLIEKIDGIGKLSGKTCNKFSYFNLTCEESKMIKVPIIAECPLNLECMVLSDQQAGDHNLILAEVKAEHIDEDKITDGHPDVQKLGMFSFAFGRYWETGSCIGRKGAINKD